nr:reverse transcriptase domain-containing protein [Tanacetum cinerariifolium]
GLPEIIKGETTSSRPATLNEAVRLTHALMEQKIQAKNERIAEGIKRKWENNNQGKHNHNNSHNRDNYRNNNHHNQNNNRRQNVILINALQSENCGRMGHKAKDCRSKNVDSGDTVQSNVVCYKCGERGHKIRTCPKKADRRGRNVQGQAYVIRDAEHNQGLNVVTARKYIERGSQLFIAQVTEKEPAKKQLQDVPVICNFPEVFPDDLPRLPPPRQVEFKIELIPGLHLLRVCLTAWHHPN